MKNKSEREKKDNNETPFYGNDAVAERIPAATTTKCSKFYFRFSIYSQFRVVAYQENATQETP